jgi:hypothetical protein
VVKITVIHAALKFAIRQVANRVYSHNLAMIPSTHASKRNIKLKLKLIIGRQYQLMRLKFSNNY